MRSQAWRIDRAPFGILAALAGGLLIAPALAEEAAPPVISVTGEASVSVPPDLAEIDAGVSTEARTAREASETNNAAMGKVLLALKGGGIEEKDFQTSRLSLQPQSAPNRGGPNAVTGYRATNRVTIKLRDVTKVAGIIDLVTGAGANGVFRVKSFEEALKKRFAAKSLEGMSIPATGMNSDIHASPEYRAHLVGVLARRALAKATA